MAEKRGNSWMKWGIIVAAVVVVGGFAIWLFHHGQDDAPAYQTVTIEPGDLTQVVTATGTLNPVTNVTVGCQVSGQISKLYVDYNSPVTNGQLIAQIDPRTYQAQVEQASAQLASGNANLELQQAETARDAELFTNKLISGSDYDTAVATLHEAEATVKINQAALDTSKANLGFCKIYSPVDGTVISRDVDVGQTVAASLQSPTLFQIANNLEQMQIDANVDEADIGGVKEGQSVDFTVDAYPNRTFHGVVTQVRNAPTTLNNVVTYDTVIGVTNADLKLKPGMTATVSIIVADRNRVLEIPNAALRFQPPEAGGENPASTAQTTRSTNNAGRLGAQRPGGRGRGRGGEQHGEQPVVHIVYVLVKDAAGNGKLEPVQIKTGITDGVFTEISEGLAEGARLATGVQSTEASGSPQAANPFG
ncbi:MAG TPA: efflux RND transporter periplasmic adaptor subunit, partial [Verrucomicrobiae bacterium]|nr:efflux RND transporter periplasmic adaptor subunit [Verrucomicrobiae bacterium]